MADFVAPLRPSHVDGAGRLRDILGRVRDPTRRNRNQGTRKRGHSQDNRLVVPQSWHDDRVFWEKLRRPVVLNRRVHNLLLRFVVEPPQPGFVYAATPNDIATVFAWLPREDLDGLELVVLRQSTRKQRILRPVWGRFMYFAEPANAAVRLRRAGAPLPSQSGMNVADENVALFSC